MPVVPLIQLLKYRIQKLINISVTFHYNSPFDLYISPHAHVMHLHMRNKVNNIHTQVCRSVVVIVSTRENISDS